MKQTPEILENNKVIEIVSQYLDLTVTPFGNEVRSVVRVDKREAMYNGNGTVYLLQMFGIEELVNNRIGAYMVFLNKDDQAGFHTHGTRNEQELYVVMQGEGEYADRAGVTGSIRTRKIKKGSITAVNGIGFHSVKNTTNEPLIIFVITSNEPKK
jgi:oxalate decarboxylase/phosphoglucose isomerase-like protein (cupin superfamily)